MGMLGRLVHGKRHCKELVGMPPSPSHQFLGSVLNMTSLRSGSSEDTGFILIAFACIFDYPTPPLLPLSVLFLKFAENFMFRVFLFPVPSSLVGRNQSNNVSCLNTRHLHTGCTNFLKRLFGVYFIFLFKVSLSWCDGPASFRIRDRLKQLGYCKIFRRRFHQGTLAKFLCQNRKFPGHVSRFAVFKVGSKKNKRLLAQLAPIRSLKSFERAWAEEINPWE